MISLSLLSFWGAPVTVSVAECVPESVELTNSRFTVIIVLVIQQRAV